MHIYWRYRNAFYILPWVLTMQTYTDLYSFANFISDHASFIALWVIYVECACFVMLSISHKPHFRVSWLNTSSLLGPLSAFQVPYCLGCSGRKPLEVRLQCSSSSRSLLSSPTVVVGGGWEGGGWRRVTELGGGIYSSSLRWGTRRTRERATWSHITLFGPKKHTCFSIWYYL